MLFFVMFFSFSASKDQVERFRHTEYYIKGRIEIHKNEKNIQIVNTTMTWFHNKIIDRIKALFELEDFEKKSYIKKISIIKNLLNIFLLEINSIEESSPNNELKNALKLFTFFGHNSFDYGKKCFCNFLSLIINKIIEDMEFNSNNTPHKTTKSYDALTTSLENLSEFNIKNYIKEDELNDSLSLSTEKITTYKLKKNSPNDQEDFYTYKKTFYIYHMIDFLKENLEKIINSTKFKNFKNETKLILHNFLLSFNAETRHAFNFLLNKDRTNQDKNYLTKSIKQNKKILANYYTPLEEAYNEEYPEKTLNYSSFDQKPEEFLEFILLIHASKSYQDFYSNIFNTQTKKINDQFLIRQFILYNFNLFTDIFFVEK